MYVSGMVLGAGAIARNEINKEFVLKELSSLLGKAPGVGKHIISK